MQHVFVTGAAGFIGSAFVDRLLANRITVTGWDNLSTGRFQFLDNACKQPNFRFVQGDNLDRPALTAAMQGADFVLHLAANADIKDGWNHPGKDLEQNTIATFNVLEAMRANGVRRIAFSSTGSVYGEAALIPTPENAPFPVQTSLYAASKVAGETMISAYAEGGQLDEAYIFRFVSILGERYTHGHVYDFYRQLLAHPDHLRVLGDGRQRKSYLYVQDCIDAVLHVTGGHTAREARHHTQVYNLGTPEYVQVNDSIAHICGALGLQPQLEYSGGDRGWIGDNPFIFLDTQKIQQTGWQPRLNIREAIVRTLRWLEGNPWVFTTRPSTHPKVTA